MSGYAILALVLMCAAGATAHCCAADAEERCTTVCTCERRECPSGWQKFGSSCYLLSTATKTWDDAQADCKAHGATLAEVTSSAENEFLKTLAANRNVWLGATDRDREGRWVWAGSNAPMTFTDWRGAQPDNGGGNEDCLQFWANRRPLQWNDQPCHDRMLSLCEKSL